MSRAHRHQVAIPADTFATLAALRDELAERSGLSVAITDVIARAAEALQANHRGGAWLAPKEAAPAYEQRHREALAAAIMQTAAACGRVVTGLAFNETRYSVEIVFGDDGPPVTFPVGALQRHADN